eukprot:2544904-Pyramimonas_sp.AAC.1
MISSDLNSNGATSCPSGPTYFKIQSSQGEGRSGKAGHSLLNNNDDGPAACTWSRKLIPKCSSLLRTVPWLWQHHVRCRAASGWALHSRQTESTS